MSQPATTRKNNDFRLEASRLADGLLGGTEKSGERRSELQTSPDDESKKQSGDDRRTRIKGTTTTSRASLFNLKPALRKEENEKQRGGKKKPWEVSAKKKKNLFSTSNSSGWSGETTWLQPTQRMGCWDTATVLSALINRRRSGKSMMRASDCTGAIASTDHRWGKIIFFFFLLSPHSEKSFYFYNEENLLSFFSAGLPLLAAASLTMCMCQESKKTRRSQSGDLSLSRSPMLQIFLFFGNRFFLCLRGGPRSERGWKIFHGQFERNFLIIFVLDVRAFNDDPSASSHLTFRWSFLYSMPAQSAA